EAVVHRILWANEQAQDETHRRYIIECALNTSEVFFGADLIPTKDVDRRTWPDPSHELYE
ncbi:MAG: hypothetical protein NWS01_11515, partial [Burkholderiales bacterium]|nr:hypothetical protein [Burkholderiales bacterium]